MDPIVDSLTVIGWQRGPQDMSDVKNWLEGKLASCLPAADLAAGEPMRRVTAIAEAISALEGRSTTIFGAHISDAHRQECAQVNEQFHHALGLWREWFGQQLGDEGVALVDQTTSTHGIRVDISAPKQDNLAVLERLEQVLRDPSLTAGWESADRLLEPGDIVATAVGLPDETELQKIAAGYERTYGSPFPPEIAATLSRFNGVAVWSSVESEGLIEVEARDLGEPVLWPANVYGDHLMFSDIDFPDDTEYYIIGGIADSGYLTLGVGLEEESQPKGVYWIDRELSAGPPERLASSFCVFLEHWCDAFLCLPLLLARANVQGWGQS